MQIMLFIAILSSVMYFNTILTEYLIMKLSNGEQDEDSIAEKAKFKNKMILIMALSWATVINYWNNGVH